MSEIAVRSNGKAVDIQPTQGQAIERLVEWAQAADAAYRVATKLCGTQFSPTAYRGKPEEATAAILAGAEVGLSPMASLRAFDNISGTPAPKAITLRAIVQAAGHEIRIGESTAAQAVVSGRRKGDSEWQTCTWTIERAQQAGFPAKNPNWKTNPTAMLVARATAELCRWIASDAIMGMPYTAEEIRDEGPTIEGKPAPKRITAAEILAAAPAGHDAPAASGDQPQPVQDDEPVRMVSDQQRKHMFALWNALGYGGDDNRAVRLTITAKILNLPEPLESSNDLTFDEAETLIAALEDRKAKQGVGGES